MSIAKMSFIVSSILLTAFICCNPHPATAEERWVGTWASGQQLTEPRNLPPEPGLTNNTLRQVIRLTLGGSQLRVQFSNAYGSNPVTINAAHLAVSTGASSIDPSTDKALTFQGAHSTTIPAGQTVYSDTLDYEAAPLSNLAVSIHFGETSADVTGHPGSRTTSYIQPGNTVTAKDMPTAAKTNHWYNLSSVDLWLDDSYACVVTLGDSITDGRGSQPNGNNRWPDNLAKRLQANPDTSKVGVVNQGIGGNAVVSGGLGPTALKRFEHDVLEQPGVRWVIILEGVNDIGGSSSPKVAKDLIAAYKQFIDSAHAKGILVYGVPILPFGDSFYDSEDHEAARKKVNKWIRTKAKFDAVIDLDRAVRDPENPTRLLRKYDTGDHLHLNVRGYQKMADAIDLDLFK
jgi:lysophospholipase L1-like esterase